jgi:hypothetical protein
MMGGGTMPASMGMMTLGRLVMYLVGDRDTWDPRGLMMGMMMGGMGMGGMGGGMGGIGGGMMGGMGGMGGMVGGFRSVPPTGVLETTLNPRQVRHLPTALVSMNGPNANSRPAVAAKGEKLSINGIEQWTDDARTRVALERLALAKAPQTVAQMVLWYVTAGASWEDVGRLSQGWGNAHELALARQFVAELDATDLVNAKKNTSGFPTDHGTFYREVKADGEKATPIGETLRTLWGKAPVLGLTAKEGVPERPKGPALACRLEILDTLASVRLFESHPSGTDWVALGDFRIKLVSLAAYQEPLTEATAELTGDAKLKAEAAAVGDAVAERIVARLVRVQVMRGPRDKAGKETCRIKIYNASPLILNGLALGGSDAPSNVQPTVLVGISLPPLKTLTVPTSADVVQRLKLKQGVRVLAADLSAL